MTTQNDKNLATASRLAILIFLLTGTATYLSIREYRQWSVLLNTRRLVAYSVVLNQLQSEFRRQPDALEKLDGPTSLAAEWYTGHSAYYPELGQVVLNRLDRGFNVTVKNPDIDPNKASLDPAVPDLRPWSMYVPETSSLERAFAAFGDLDIGLAKYMQAQQEKERKESPEEFQKKHHENPNPRADILEIEDYGVDNQIRANLSSSGVEVDSNTYTIPAYKRLERQTFSSKVRIPIIEVETSSEVAVWLIEVMVLMSSVLVVNALSSVTSPASGGEPWFVIDANTVSARLLSKLWLIALGLSPVVVAISCFALLRIRNVAGDITAKEFYLSAAVLMLLTVLSGINTIRAAVRLHVLSSASKL